MLMISSLTFVSVRFVYVIYKIRFKHIYIIMCFIFKHQEHHSPIPYQHLPNTNLLLISQNIYITLSIYILLLYLTSLQTLLSAYNYLLRFNYNGIITSIIYICKINLWHSHLYSHGRLFSRSYLIGKITRLNLLLSLSLYNNRLSSLCHFLQLHEYICFGRNPVTWCNISFDFL